MFLFGCEALNDTRLAKLSFAGVEDLLGIGELAGLLGALMSTEGVDLPDIGGVGRRGG